MIFASDADRVAIVTGAARGLGLGVVRQLVDDGWNVCGVDLDPGVGQVMADLGDGDDSRVMGLRADVSDADACRTVVGQVTQWRGRLDALVNNAGVGGPSTMVHQTEPSEFDHVLRVNLVAPYLMVREVIPRIIEGGRGGSVVNIGSVLGQRAEAGSGAYAASKAGVAQLGQAMALELARHQIRVNTVTPGYILSAMHEQYMADLARATGRTCETVVASIRESVPLGRHGTPEDVGDVVAWLVSPAASYVTGQTIAVNGGILLT